MKKILAVLSIFIFTSLLVPVDGFAGPKSKYSTWRVKIHFIAGQKDYNAADTAKWVKGQVAQAERLFNSRPRLKIDYKIIRKTRVGGRTLASMKFKNGSVYSKYMDKYFDNVATTKTKGYMIMLMVDDICIKKKCIGGRAWFPHWVTPFSRKYGIIMQYNHSEPVVAHEMGHMFSAKHTFEAYTNLDRRLLCNKNYKPKGSKNGKGYCNSCKGSISGKGKDKTCNGRANVMDYCPASSYYINACQKRRAGNQRKKYMTNKGKTNYRRLKGIR